MWKTRRASPSVTHHVIFVADETGSVFSFPIERGNFTERLLRLTFPCATGLTYVDPADDPDRKVSVRKRDGGFIEPKGGWIKEDRRYFVVKKKRPTNRHTMLVGLEFMQKYQALTQGVTLYFERPEPKKRTLVAAIDFGTSFSGYAYTFDYDPDTIYTSEWSGEGMSSTTDKAPTTILLKPNGEFHSFGYEAEDEYALLVDGEAFSDWYYFRNFKMTLYRNKYLRRDTVLRDMEGKHMPALEIFAMAIRHMRKCLMSDVRAREPRVKPDDISWVVTVPAIWSDAAKQFMREAAVCAGIKNEHLKLVLEPEAASLYCKTRDPSEMNAIASAHTDNPLMTGSRYILLDLGGGTADMSAHEILEDGCLKEIHRATGDALGGTNVDEAFNKLLSELVGAELMLDFFQDYRQDFVELMRDFESKKRLPTERTSSLVFKLPTSLCNMAQDRAKATMEELVQRSSYAKHIKVNAEKLMLDGTLISQLFKDTVDGIVSYIKEMRANPKLADVTTVVLAGGFSESKHLQHAVQKTFPKAHVVSPATPSAAILKGAVMLGHRPDAIVERVARYTYGVSYARKPFYKGEDPEELKARRNGETYCDDVFEKLAQIGQPIKCTDVFTVRRTSFLSSPNSKKRRLYTKLYASIEDNPEYCTDECFCVKIGEVVRHPPEAGWPDVLLSVIEIKFGETEMTVRIREQKSGIEYKARVDSL